MEMRVKNNIYVLFISTILLSCATPSYLPREHKIGEVEYFDLEEFNKNKGKGTNTYYLLKKDTLEVLISEEKEYFYESIIPYKKNYELVKRYYLNKKIKERGKYYYYGYRSFKIGKWEYFDEEGNLIKIEDKDGKDRDYPMTYKEAFRKVSHHFGFSKKKLHIQVLLGNDRLFWVFNKNGKTKSVDMLTGKVYNATLGKGNDVYRGKDDE